MPVAAPLSASGRFIVDANGNRVRLAGVNWYGASEDLGVPAGLDRTHRRTLARNIARHGFNSVRFPFSVWMTGQTAPVPDQYLAANRDLRGSTPVQVYAACVRALTDEDLIVIPNCHLLDFGWCCSNTDENGLWFNDRWSGAQFIAAWQHITERFRTNPLVAAMDIKNEPRQATVGGRVLEPTWGTGDPTDFAAMYTTVGNLIHQIDPHPLIICEGLSYAGDLTGAARHPVRLERPGKVVYSMHDYPWFHADGQSQAAYLADMTKAGGYLVADGLAPLWIGEFGNDTGSLANFGLDPTSQVGNANNGVWWTNISAWLTESDLDWCWWALNPTHAKGSTPGTGQRQYNWGDREPYGLLTSDWRDAGNPVVMKMLKSMTRPRTGPGVTPLAELGDDGGGELLHLLGLVEQGRTQDQLGPGRGDLVQLADAVGGRAHDRGGLGSLHPVSVDLRQRGVHPCPGPLGVVVDRDVYALGDGEGLGGPSCLRERRPHHRDLLGEPRGGARPGAEEPVAQAYRAPQRGLAGRAEPERRVRLLKRLGLHRRVLELPELPVEGDAGLRPQRLHQRDPLGEPRDVPRGLHAEGGERLARAPGAHPDLDPAPAELVQTAHALG
jgi:endoglucanase